MILKTDFKIIPYMNTTMHGCVRKVLLLKYNDTGFNVRAGGDTWLCVLGGQETQNVPFTKLVVSSYT